MNKDKLVPELRFPEFQNDGEWDMKYLGEVTKFSQGIQVSLDLQKKSAEKGYIKFLRIENYTQNSQDFRFIPVESSSNKIINKDEIAIVRYGATAGFICKGLEGVLANNLFKVSPDSEVLLGMFLYQILKSDKTKQYFKSVMRGGAMPALSFKIVSNLLIKIPSLLEQQKIANCLSSLDVLLTAETEKIDYLKDHKKGLLQQLFPANGETKPQYRFPEFENEGDWEEVILGEICTFSKGRGLPKSAIVENGTLPCVHYGQLFTQYTEVIKTIKSFTDMKNGVLSKKNDVLMPTSDVTPKGLAKASCIKDENVVLGGDILIIKPDGQKVFGEFLSRYIRHLENEVLKLVSGSTVFHLYASSMKLLILHLPSINEQQKIAKCLSSADDLIEAQTTKIKALKDHKKGLMQQLFPTVNELAV